MKHIRCRIFVAWIQLILISLPAIAAGDAIEARRQQTSRPILVGQEVTLNSIVLDQEQKVMVYLPPNDGNNASRWPVVFVLDGEYTFLHTVSATKFLVANGKMPPTIIVGVCSKDRLRDFTPELAAAAHAAGLESSGGANKFLQYLEEELIPYLDNEYPTQPFRILMGHSLGGLFATHAMIARPQLFSGVITLEPSLWWDDRSIVGQVARFFKEHPDHKGRLIMAEGISVEGWRKDWPKLAPSAPAGLRWELLEIPGESHEGMAFRGRYEALKALFKDYVPQMRQNAKSATLQALEGQYKTLSEDYGYQVIIPDFALLEVAQRAANRQDFLASVQTLQRAAELYPKSAEVFALLKQMESKAANAPPVAEVPAASFAVVDPQSPYLGRWEGTLKTEPGVPSEIVVVLENTKGKLTGNMLARGVADDGSDFRMDIAATRISDDTLEWDRPDNNGGTHVHIARLSGPRTLDGEVLLKGGNPSPPRFVAPTVTFSLRKQAESTK